MPASHLTLEEHEWREHESRHRARVIDFTAKHLDRRARRERHPVEDFLWTYYSMKPAELRRWHPGAGAILENGSEHRASWRYYTSLGQDVTLDLAAFFTKRGSTVDYVENLLSATLERAPRFGCFGLHEWAMVYRLTPEQLRHVGLSLRVGHEATNQVVESHAIACSHFDAYRFFTDDAAPLNELRPTRDNQPDLEQPGCLHAGMDLYKWVGKLGPIVAGNLMLDCFEFARDIREVDMQASPYDVSEYSGADGRPLTAIAIETPEGKNEYAERQRDFAVRGNALRERVLTAISLARSTHGAESPRPPQS